MAPITQQFIEALGQWVLKTGESEKVIVALMFDMANFQNPETHESDEPPLTISGAQGLVALLKEYSGFTETFCVTAFVHAIEDRLRVAYELYEDKQNQPIQESNRLRAIADDPERFRKLQNQIESSQKKERALGIEPKAENFKTPEELAQLADELEEFSQKGIQEDARDYLVASLRLQAWREVVALIVEATNLDAAKNYDDWNNRYEH